MSFGFYGFFFYQSLSVVFVFIFFLLADLPARARHSIIPAHPIYSRCYQRFFGFGVEYSALRALSRGNIVEASSLLIQEGYGAERATAPSPNNYEMIEKLGYLISLLSTVAPLQKNP